MKIKTFLISITIAMLSACATVSNEGDTKIQQQEPAQQLGEKAAGLKMTASKGEDAAVVEADATKGESTVELYPGTGNFINVKAASRKRFSKTKEGDITLNFQGTDLRELIKTILGDILKKNYTIDDKVKGQVSLITSSPIPREAIIPTLETLLRINGAVLVVTNDLYEVIPEAAALSGILNLRTRLSPDLGYQILIVPLKYIAAKEMKKIISPIKSKKGLLEVDEPRNLLLISGTQSELASILETVEIFDVNQLKGMSVGLFKLQLVDAKTIVGELQKIFGGDSSGTLGGMVKFVPIERLNTLLVITPQKKYLREARVWIERLDRSESVGGMGLYVYAVQSSRAAHLADLLGQLFDKKDRSSGRQPASSRSGTPVSRAQARAKTKAKQKAVKSTALAKTSQRSTSGFEVGNITIIADEENNALLIKATPGDYAKILQALKKLDVLPMQVLIEASIVEVSLTDELSYGLEWYFKHNDVLQNKRAVGSLDLGGGLAAAVPGFSYTVFDAANSVRGVLNMLASDGKVKIISSPSLMVLDNHSATIRVGDQVPIRTSETTSQSTSGDNPIITSTIQFRDTGILLEVTPHVNAGGMVVMEINQEVSDVSKTQSSGIDSPTINQRQITTTVAVQSEDTIVLGGLIRENDTYSTAGIPGLRDLPLIGWLFGSTTKSARRTELLVLITPTAVDTRDKAREVTMEYKEKMESLTSSFTDITNKPLVDLYWKSQDRVTK